MQPGHYVSCVTGTPRSGDSRDLMDRAEALGYEVWTVSPDDYRGPTTIWFARSVRGMGCADVIYLSRLFTANEWNNLPSAFKIKLVAAER